MFSLTPEGYRALTAGLAERRIVKEYTAIVAGWPQPRQGLIDLPLRRNASGRTVPSPHGAPARTRYRTRRRLPGAALLDIQPLTGRTHQIRAHFAARGHPVLGDPVYGDRSNRRLVPRLCLHAGRIVLAFDLIASLLPLGIRVPSPDGAPRKEGEPLIIEAPEPRAFASIAARLTAGGKRE